MNDDRIDAEIRAAFEAIELPESLVPEDDGRRNHWRSEAISIGLVAAAALALFLPWMLSSGERELEARPAAPAAFQPPSGTRVVRLDVEGAQEGWPEAGATVDVFAVRGGGPEAHADRLLREAVVAEDAALGTVAVAVDPSLAVRAIHANQADALTLAVVLPDGRRVVELREDSPVDVGDVVDVLVSAERDGGLVTWTAITDAEVVYQGAGGPLVALSEAEAAMAVGVQHQGTIRLSRHLKP